MSALQEFERRAFSSMLAANQLPRPQSNQDADALRKAGVRVQGSGLLLQATLPSGWQAIQTEARHGQLIDDKGRVRAELFYKGAVHETKGHLTMRHRYTTYCGRPGNSDWCVWDYAAETVLFEDSSAPRSEQYDRAKAWLNKHYPKWEDPSKYWNDKSTSSPWRKLWSR